ncbi:hypothetical protein MUK42_32882 [Musa troglodytarum]|uniref:Uncharacterized protein n=1 Tax=Musa troglodytarum TaxID=320322 RepID=A0A9E7FAN6_9LILI|nr:hypothetical protein MUK42_32882 [Musa troglodytarum]
MNLRSPKMQIEMLTLPWFRKRSPLFLFFCVTWNSLSCPSMEGGLYRVLASRKYERLVSAVSPATPHSFCDLVLGVQFKESRDIFYGRWERKIKKMICIEVLANLPASNSHIVYKYSGHPHQESVSSV